MRVVERPDGHGWRVVDDHGNELAGPFETNESAWRWVDRNNAADIAYPNSWCEARDRRRQ